MAPEIGNSIALTIIATLVLIVCCLTQNSSQLPDQPKTRKQNANGTTCGSQFDVADRVEICAKPVMGIVEGTLEKWPRTLADQEIICEEIHGAERCIRDEGRRCGQGLQRTIISTVANSVQRARKRDCAKAIQPQVLRLTQCIEKHTKDTKKLVASVVTRLDLIESKMTDTTQRTNAVCCTIKSMETEMKVLFDNICPLDSALMVGVYKTVMEDVLNLICRSAKCQGDIFQGHKVPKAFNTANGKLISTVLKILFSLARKIIGTKNYYHQLNPI